MLFGFFRFFSIKKNFDPEKHFVNVSNCGPVIVCKAKIADYFSGPVLEDKPEEFYFLIRDPFNNTYNPAKNFRLATSPKRMFEQAHFALLQNRFLF